jgi:hypothetical protein
MTIQDKTKVWRDYIMALRALNKAVANFDPDFTDTELDNNQVLGFLVLPSVEPDDVMDEPDLFIKQDPTQ